MYVKKDKISVACQKGADVTYSKKNFSCGLLGQDAE